MGDPHLACAAAFVKIHIARCLAAKRSHMPAIITPRPFLPPHFRADCPWWKDRYSQNLNTPGGSQCNGTLLMLPGAAPSPECQGYYPRLIPGAISTASVPAPPPVSDDISCTLDTSLPVCLPCMAWPNYDF